ncbi:MAG TPA: metallophosphoesterase family protein, partial [Candidatus Goldiibacteriota bacterium]|nr:metallophosphoesterase family protein [Candidatus Goldiibacteriota bacterium]
MKLAFISDIHANYDALQAVLAYIRQVEASRIYCCGDIGGYGGQLNECVNALRDAGAICVKGNHEEFLLGRRQGERFGGAAGEAIEWQKGIITKANKQFLGRLPAALVIGGVSIRMCHGSPSEPEDFIYVLSESATIEA